MDPTQDITTADPTAMTDPPPAAKPSAKGDKPKRYLKALRAATERCERLRKQKIPIWQANVDARVGKILDVSPERDTITVPVDWARTKNKIAQLFFQVPTVRLSPRAPQWQKVTPLFGAAINFELAHEIHAEKPVEQCLADAINAAGIGIMYCAYEAEFEDVEVPAQDLSARSPEELVSLASQGPIEMRTVKKPIAQRYTWTRISPANFLWPVDFIGNEWNRAPWLGFNDRLSRAEMERLGWVDEDEELEGDDDRTLKTVNPVNEDGDHQGDGEQIAYTQVFYRQSYYRADVKDPFKIGRIVWVDGKKEPAVDEDFLWQKWVPEIKMWVGMTTFPLKPITLTTISDEAVPPSDTEIGRPQVMELNRSRTQMLLQRDRSVPVRWFDVNLVDEEVAEQIRRGTYQDMIPTQGPGGNVIGEVARASYPRESHEFMGVINRDLDEAWSSGPAQQGYDAPGDTSATEAKIIQGNYTVGLDHQRAKTLGWFLECTEATADQMQLFQEIEKFAPFTTPEGTQELLAWDRTKVPGKYVYQARPDAAVRVDVGQKRNEVINKYKLLRQDPLVNPQGLLREVFDAFDSDPQALTAPPKEPDKPMPKPATFSFKGDDLANPMAVALIQKVTPISPQEVKAARILMADCGIPVAPATTLPDETQIAPDQGGGPPNSGTAPDGESQPHGGLPPTVNPVDQRYERPGEAQATP